MNELAGAPQKGLTQWDLPVPGTSVTQVRPATGHTQRYLPTFSGSRVNSAATTRLWGLVSILWGDIHTACTWGNKTRNTEGAVRVYQYGPLTSIQPEKRSLKDCIEAFWPYWPYLGRPLKGFLVLLSDNWLMYTNNIFYDYLRSNKLVYMFSLTQVSVLACWLQNQATLLYLWADIYVFPLILGLALAWL